jgi:ABC-type uncharacterized transport system involved in gliding motility auxiliary subunit
LVYSVGLAGNLRVRQETADELRHNPRLAYTYGVLQLWILVPLAVFVFAIVQATTRRTRVGCTSDAEPQ